MSRRVTRWAPRALLASTAVFACGATARAQTANATQVQEIVVTAEKRATTLEHTPEAITALRATDLQQRQVRDLRDLRSIAPNFEMGDAQGVAQITIRGIGSSAFLPGTEGAAAVNENEVYVSRNVAQQAGMFDVSDIEVVRGPQGTLYGRNATAGAVNIETARPTDTFSGYVNATVGNYGEVRVETAAGGPVDSDDKLLIRLAAFYERHDGYGENLVTGTGIDDKNAYGLRATVVFRPAASLTDTLIAQYYDERDHQGAFHYFGAAGLSGQDGALGLPPLFIVDGGYAPTNERDIANGIDPQFSLPIFAATNILEWKSGPFSIKSITGYRQQWARFTYDLDGGSPLNLFELEGEPARQFSQELQFHYDTDRFNFTGGLYYFNEHDASSPAQIIASTGLITSEFGIPYPTPGFVTLGNLGAELTTEAGAVFGQGTYNISSKLSVTAGLRYSGERKGIASIEGLDLGEGGLPLLPPYPGPNPLPAPYYASKSFYSMTPKFGIQYQLDPRTLLYASFSQGFKSGGFDTGVAEPKPFAPEKLTDYEAGIKTVTPDRRLRLSVGGFYYDYKDLQVTQVVDLTVQTANAATARDYGLEAEFNWLPASQLQFDGSAAWTHARYVSYIGPDPALPLLPTANFAGNALDNAPDYQATLGGQFTFNVPLGTLTGRAEVEYSSRFFFSPGNQAELSQGAFAKGDLYVIWKPSSDWVLTAYVKNVGNTTTKTSALVATTLVFNPIVGSLAPPRLYGLEVSRKF